MDHVLKNLPQFGALAAIIVVSYFLMRRNWQRSAQRSRTTPLQEAKEQIKEKSRDLALLDAPPEVTRWQVELHETARDLKGEIDSKLSALQALIRVAREEREKLEAVVEQAELLRSTHEREA